MHPPISIPKHSPWVTQILVLRALLKRVVITRFGKYQLGFFWMVFEPLLGTIVLGVLIGSIAQRTVPEIPYPLFLLQGFLLLKLFTSPMKSGLTGVGANSGLTVYPTVKPLDPILARFLFDLLTVVFSMVLFISVSMWIGIKVSLGSLHVLFACYIITWLMGCGLGLIFGVAAAHFKETEKIVAVIQRPLIFVSAVLTPLASIPAAAQKYLIWNPLVHTIELSRSTFFPAYDSSQLNLLYPATVAIIVLALGLILFENNRNFLSQR
jgi:capsular polysaccharide transport system permease protein